MAIDLADQILSFPTPEIVQKVAANVGESPSATQKANGPNSVKNLMMTSGIAGDRITTAGFGSDQPVAPNDTEAGRAKNRRTELVVLKR